MKKTTTLESEEPVIEYTKYEKARMIGSRSLQLAMGAPFLVKLAPEELEKVSYNPIQIALKEYEEGILPITVKRPTPGGKQNHFFSCSCPTPSPQKN